VRIMSGWTEPALDQGVPAGQHGGVLEYMQPLGEMPNAKVRARVKPEGRKSVLGKSAAGASAQDTPEGSPAPLSQSSAAMQPPIVIDDENDEDYAPKVAGKKKERRAPTRAQRRSESTPATGGAASKKIKSTTKSNKAPTSPPRGEDKIYDAAKLKSVVNAAKKRANEVGKPDLAAAVHEIWVQSLTNKRLTELLERILEQRATKAQTSEFQGYVRTAKKKLKNNDAKEAERKNPPLTNGGQSLPVRSPSKLTHDQGDTSTSALPSTELTDTTTTSRPSHKIPSASKSTGRRKSTQGHTMSISPSKKRSGSVGSDSSLTDMTSNPDDTEAEELDAPVPVASTRVNGVTGKDHAAERGSLAAPARGIKRSSAEADLQDEERKRALDNLAAKKQKLGESVIRSDSFQESNIRPPVKHQRQSTLRMQRSRADGLAPPSLTLAPPTSPGLNTRGVRGISTDLDSPLSELSAPSSRRSTPQVIKKPIKPFGKRAKTKQS